MIKIKDSSTQFFMKLEVSRGVGIEMSFND